MGRSRWHRRIVRSLVLGVVSSVVVSLGAGVLGGNAHVRRSATVEWRTRADFLTWTQYTVLVPPLTDPGDPMEVTVLRHRDLARRDRYLPPGAPAPEYTDPGAQAGYPVRFITITTFGLPLESFWGYEASDGLRGAGGVRDIRGGDWLGVIAPGKGKPGSGMRVFAWWPLWGGLIGNAAIHGAAWFVVFSLVRAGVTARRRARGRCLACGYNRRGLGAGTACPECGSG